MSLAESSDAISPQRRRGIANIGEVGAYPLVGGMRAQPIAALLSGCLGGSSSDSAKRRWHCAGRRGVPEPLRTAAVAGGTATGAGQLHPAVQPGREGMDDSERWF